MFEVIGEALTGAATGGFTALFGGITGIVGAWIRNKHDLEVMRFQSAEAAKGRQHDLDLIEREAASAEKIALIQYDETRLTADSNSLQASIESESQGATWSKDWSSKIKGFWAGLIAFLLALVDVIRGLIRPVITGALVWQTHEIFVTILTFVGGLGGLPQATASTVIVRVVDMILYLTCMAVGWWFGSRGQAIPSARTA